MAFPLRVRHPLPWCVAIWKCSEWLPIDLPLQPSAMSGTYADRVFARKRGFNDVKGLSLYWSTTHVCPDDFVPWRLFGVLNLILVPFWRLLTHIINSRACVRMEKLSARTAQVRRWKLSARRWLVLWKSRNLKYRAPQ